MCSGTMKNSIPKHISTWKVVASLPSASKGVTNTDVFSTSQPRYGKVVLDHSLTSFPYKGSTFTFFGLTWILANDHHFGPLHQFIRHKSLPGLVEGASPTRLRLLQHRRRPLECSMEDLPSSLATVVPTRSTRLNTNNNNRANSHSGCDAWVQPARCGALPYLE
jgi:hypothetical protein